MKALLRVFQTRESGKTILSEIATKREKRIEEHKNVSNPS